MKKIFFLVIILVVILSIIACSTEISDQSIDNQQGSSNADDSGDDISDESNNESIGETESNEVNEIESSNEGLPIPKGYPENLIPIMSGSRIFAGGDEILNDGKASIWIKVLSTEKSDEVSAFYRAVLNGASEKKDEKFGGIHFLEGILEGKQILIKITEDMFKDGFPTSTLIQVIGIGSIENEISHNTIDIGRVNIDLTNEDKMPNGYRKDLVPIVEGTKIYDGREMEQNENITYMIMCYSKEEKADIYEFYKELMQNFKDKEEGTFSSGSHYINGTIDNVRAYLMIGVEDVHEEYKSRYSITMEILD